MLLEEVERQTSVLESVLPPDPKSKKKITKKSQKAPPLTHNVHIHQKVHEKIPGLFALKVKN